MMREARTPHKGCGLSREAAWTQWVGKQLRGCASARAIVIVVLSIFVSNSVALAQDPSAVAGSTKAPSSFNEKPGGMFGDINRSVDQSQPLKLNGDELIYDTAGNRVVARGNVEIFYNDNILTADEVIYDQGAGTLTAAGNVTLKEPQGNIIRADRYTLTDDFRDGFVQSLSVVTRDETRISAERATRRDGNVTEFQDGKFTPCKTSGTTPPLWCLSAARITHDKDAATITYQDAYFEIYGQPVFYLPYFQHADPSVKRKSGFLTPEFGQTDNLGFITGIPYYFALDPSYDFTFNPLYMSRQGVLWQGEWRQRFETGQYTIKAAGIDQNADDLPGIFSDDSKFDGWRGTVETRGQFSLSSWWKAGWDVTLESDDEFRRFYRLDNILLTDRVNQVYLTGLSDRNYFAARAYHFGGLTLEDTAQTESYTHPIIDYNYVFADPILGGELKLDTNALSFTRNDGATIGGIERDQNINRIVTEAKWRRRLTDTVGITYTPFANLRGDIYQFENFTDPESVALNVDGTVNDASRRFIGDETTVRGVAAGGVTVAYPWLATTPGASHIIEPIGQIIARQENVVQRDLPVEDARSLVFDDTNLFEVSKFSGLDRVETGTRANAGVQYTFQANNGGYARLLAGQSFHLSGDNIYLNPGRDDQGNRVFNPSSGLETDRSDYVLGAYLAPIEQFRFISQSRFDDNDFGLRRQDATGEISFGPLVASATYAFTAADPELGFDTDQQDVYGLFSMRLTDTWSIAAGARYDIDASEFLSDSLQVRYADDCYVMTVTYNEIYYQSQTIDDDRSLMFRFEFKHLGEVNYRTDALDFAFGGDQRTTSTP